MDFEKFMDNLKKRGFEPHLFKTGAEAVAYLKEQIVGERVVFGGSMTLKQLGVFEALQERNNVWWHWYGSKGDRYQAEREATVYLTSANAVSMDGEIVNIDGVGNRVANSIYGNNAVYYVFGQNKIAPDLTQAIERARNVASPLNAKRLGSKTPCVAAGKCLDCQSPERICNVMNIVMHKTGGTSRCEAIIIQEDLGF